MPSKEIGDSSTRELLSVSSADRRLVLVVAENLAISFWTLSDDAGSWGARRVVIDRARMLQ